MAGIVRASGEGRSPNGVQESEDIQTRPTTNRSHFPTHRLRIEAVWRLPGLILLFPFSLRSTIRHRPRQHPQAFHLGQSGLCHPRT